MSESEKMVKSAKSEIRTKVIPGNLVESDIPFPEMDFDNYGPQAFGTEIVGEKASHSEDQEFVIDYTKVKNLWFDTPGRNLPKKRLYTVKAIHQDGRLVQLPYEPQIQNTVAGDVQDAVGLRRYQNKGIKLLFNFETMQPVYCAAWGCWAQADGVTGFCTTRHAQHTMPNRYSQAGEIMQGLMSQGVTTSRTWSM